MKKLKSSMVVAVWLLAAVVLFFPVLVRDASAYIGPGAGIAFFSSFFILLATFLLAFLIILFWPVRLFWQSVKRRFKYRQYFDKNSHSKTRKVVILGLDGLDPVLTEQYMQKGILPHFSALKEEGSYSRLQTTCPAISPVAWSSFATGMTPARHAIFDFFTRDVKTYLPILSSVDIQKSAGKLSGPKIKSLKKGRAFWEILGDVGICSSIIRVPITFPPVKFAGRLLSAMCVPDLKGTQGTFSFYTTCDDLLQKRTGGVCFKVVNQGGKISSFLYGPEDPQKKGSPESRIPFEVFLSRNAGGKNAGTNGAGTKGGGAERGGTEGGYDAELQIAGQKFSLKQGEFSPWIRIPFPIGRKKISGICRFLIQRITPEFEMYVTPINIDPEKPVLPISHPFVYAMYLSKVINSYATLGLAEDTWALNERVLNEKSFLDQAYANHKEREKMFFHELDKVRKGVCACVFDTTDRIQHMFWRYLEKDHPTHQVAGDPGYENTIEELYRNMDDLLGRVRQKIDRDTLLIVMSDHGFKSFRRCVNLNSWLYLNRFLALKEGAKESGEWFSQVDWSKTQAYALGLGGIFVNLKGRESRGIVQPGAEFKRLKEEISLRLTGLMDKDEGKVAINQVYDCKSIYQGPYTDNGPDLVIGYAKGYRMSWDSVVGKVNTVIFEDNTKSWSGDHCIDPEAVPGVLFCSRKIKAATPRIIDIAPTILREFNLQAPSLVEGKPLFD
ncbi:MAG: alkaline phosphatase family protein [bacterium]